MRYIISPALTSLALLAPVWASPALAEVPRVVTDLPPVHSLVAQVMGDLGTPELLLDQGASEHDLQLRPSQAAALEDAALVVWIGPELTPSLARALDGLGDADRTLGLLAVEGTHLQDFAEDGAHGREDHGHDHAQDAGKGHDDHGHDDHGHDDHGHGHDDHGHGHDDHADHSTDAEGHDHAGHSHEGTDPHAWLDPANARLWLGVIADRLATLDPANADTYRANAAAAQAGVDALEAEVAAQMAAIADRPAIVFHDAYGYFAGHFGVTITGSVLLGDATPAGAARLAALREATEGGAVACVFPEAQHDAAPAEQLAEGTGARLGAALDPVGSTLEPGPALYPALMRGLAGALSDCLSGA